MCQSCPTLCDPVNCSLPGSSVHGILQARILQRVAISFSRGSSRSRDRTRVSRIAGRCFNLWATREAHIIHVKNIIWYLSFSVWLTSLNIIISRSRSIHITANGIISFFFLWLSNWISDYWIKRAYSSLPQLPQILGNYRKWANESVMTLWKKKVCPNWARN